jgi:hypothetical protein
LWLCPCIFGGVFLTIKTGFNACNYLKQSLYKFLLAGVGQIF